MPREPSDTMPETVFLNPPDPPDSDSENSLPSSRLYEAILDALPDSVAVLDETGTIVYANAAWRNVAEANGLVWQGHGVGTDYLEVCSAAVGEHTQTATAALNGIQGILSGQHPDFSLVYAGHTPDTKRWFILHARRLDTPGPAKILVRHENITALQLAENALRKSEIKYNGVVDLIGLGVSIISPQMKILSVNRQLLKWFPHIDILQNPLCFNAFHQPPTNEICPACPVQKTLQDGQVHETVKQIVIGEEVRHFMVVTAPITNKAGAVTAVIQILEDYTERFRSEETLRQSEERYRGIFENIQDIYEESRLDGTLMEISPSVEAILGYKREALIGKPVAMLYAKPEEREKLVQAVKKQGQLSDYEITLKHKKGALVSCTINAKLIIDAANAPVKLVANIHDITRRKQSEKERLQLATAIEQIAESIIVTNQEGDILYTNPAFERLSGYTGREVAGRKWTDLKKEKADRKVYPTVLKTLAGKNVWRGRFTNRKKDGSRYPVAAAVSPVCDEAGAVTHYVIAERDLTREMELEKHQRRSQKMEAIGTLAAGIAHDFNNILGSIILNTELAQSRMATTDLNHQLLGRITKAGRRAEELIEQILTFSRQTQQKKHLIQLTPLIKEAAKFLRSTLPATIEIRQSLDTDGLLVFADPTQIHQVILNLSNNAAHAMKEKGGVLSLTLAPVQGNDKIAAHPDLLSGTFIKLTVSDTGHGMDEAVLERVFDPFFTTKKVGEGTGMGLAVVHGIVKEHGGAVTIHSIPGSGTDVDIYLPAKEGETAERPKKPASIRGGRERILFVDDEESLVLVATMILESLGYRVCAKTDSPEALETFTTAPDSFDLVITDLTMPKMDGAALIRRLKKVRPGIPVILCTGYHDILSPEELEALSVAGFLKKPPSKQSMAECIRNAIEKK